MTRCPGCGAEPTPLGGCREVYHEALGLEQHDPLMYRWHAPLVAAYLLQHPDEGTPQHRSHQVRLLQLFLDRGLDGLDRFTSAQRKRNSHKVPGPPDLDAAVAVYLPAGDAIPTTYAVTYPHLLGPRGDFVGDGHDAYGRRMEDLCAATVAAWVSAQGVQSGRSG